MTFRPVAYLKDVGSEEDPCFVPCAQGDEGSFGVYTLEQVSENNARLAEALRSIHRKLCEAQISPGYEAVSAYGWCIDECRSALGASS